MLLLFVVTTIGTRGFIELFPGFADRVFGRGPQGLAMLTSTVGLGAIISGSFWLATRFRHKGMAAGLECSPMGTTEGRPCRPA